MRFMQTESVLQTKNRSEPAKNRFSVALLAIINLKNEKFKLFCGYVLIIFAIMTFQYISIALDHLNH